IAGDVTGPVFEGWTLLSALAAETERLRLGLLVTSNRFRPPAMLAKIAATVDVVSNGRLDFGIGAGSRPGHPVAPHHYASHRPAFPGSGQRGGQSGGAVSVHPRLGARGGPVRPRRLVRAVARRVRHPQPRAAAASADPHPRPLERDPACGRRTCRYLERPR